MCSAISYEVKVAKGMLWSVEIQIVRFAQRSAATTLIAIH